MLRYAGKDFLQTELDELELIANFEGDVEQFVNARLHNEETDEWNEDLVRMYKNFCDCNLVCGVEAPRQFFFTGITYKAGDLVQEVKNAQKSQIDAIKADKRFAIYTTLLGAAGGLVVTIIGQVLSIFLE